MLNNVIVIGEILEITDNQSENIILKVDIPVRLNEKKRSIRLPITLSENAITIVKHKRSIGDVIGIRGYLTYDDKQIKVIGQRVELFT